MDPVDIKYAEKHLAELIERAVKGEDVYITVPSSGAIRMHAVSSTVAKLGIASAPRVTDLMAPFVPLKEPRMPGQLEGTIPPPPEGFFDPLTDEELKDWYGDDA
jgi:antitoxin (DNA-binding transcriptional repressor) of toxin-antitoxin stability system